MGSTPPRISSPLRVCLDTSYFQMVMFKIAWCIVSTTWATLYSSSRCYQRRGPKLTIINKPTINGFIIMEDSGVVKMDFALVKEGKYMLYLSRYFHSILWTTVHRLQCWNAVAGNVWSIPQREWWVVNFAIWNYYGKMVGEWGEGKERHFVLNLVLF